MPSAASHASTARDDAALISLVGVAHCISHFSQLLLPPLFPWLKDEFHVGYAELGFLMTVFFVVSSIVQTASGFLVDRHGPRPVLFGGLALIAVAAVGYAVSTSYAQLALFAAVAGVGNGVFHPVDYTLINRKVASQRLGHAFSVHGITGSLGWAIAPAVLVPLTLAASWRTALLCAAAIVVAVMALLALNRRRLAIAVPPAPPAKAQGAADGSLDFLRIPAVWVCFLFFFLLATVLSAIQSFAPQAARELHAVPASLAAICLSVYMVCSAGGMVVGGFLARDPSRAERIAGTAFGTAALFALTLGYATVPAQAVPVLFGAMGIASGIAGPSRDLIVKRAAPDNATGRVYGVVYSGLDIGQAVAPLVYGLLMDWQRASTVWLGIALTQFVLVATAFNVRRARRTAPATAARAA